MKIKGKEYIVIDTLDYITLADSFIKDNKVGSGHGEAKLYVGNESERLLEFFGDFNNNCIFYKKDFELFLGDVKNEYTNPQQDYQKIATMAERFKERLAELNDFKGEYLFFDMYRADVKPPRVYINAESNYYNYMRCVALPNISYLSVMKLKDEYDKYLYYFRIFADYKPNIITYQIPEEVIQEEYINIDDSLTERKRETIIKARVGQGEYRNKLLEECSYCPFTLINDERLLIASHIKPWSKSDNNEKVDCKNGFIFTPTYDKLFDRGFITFSDEKKLMVSPWISPMNQKRLSIYDGMNINKLPIDDKRKVYLQYHREHIFKS